MYEGYKETKLNTLKTQLKTMNYTRLEGGTIMLLGMGRQCHFAGS